MGVHPFSRFTFFAALLACGGALGVAERPAQESRAVRLAMEPPALRKAAAKWSPRVLGGLTLAEASAPLDLAASHGGLDPGEASSPHPQEWLLLVKESLGEFVLGVLICILAMPGLWINERRSAVCSSLVARAHRDCVELGDGGQKADPALHGRPVLLAGRAVAGGLLEDRRFALELRGFLALQTEVEIYRWVEIPQKRVQEGEGSTTTEYTYEKRWCSSWEKSANFRQPTAHYNPLPPGLEIGLKESQCQRVTVGPYALSSQQVKKLKGWQPAAAVLPKVVRTRAETGHECVEFQATENGSYYWRAKRETPVQEGESPQDPGVGDCRVTFFCIPEGEVTICGVPAPMRDGLDALVPYRPISRSLLGWSQAREQEAILEAGTRSREDLVKEAACDTGLLACLCCCCNLCAKIFRVDGMVEEIFFIRSGQLDRRTVFEMIDTSRRGKLRVFRVVLWLMMLAGLYLAVAPVQPLLLKLPVLRWAGGFGVLLVCALLTDIIATALVGFAYFAYRPWLSLWLLLLSVAVAAVLPLVCHFYG